MFTYRIVSHLGSLKIEKSAGTIILQKHVNVLDVDVTHSVNYSDVRLVAYTSFLKVLECGIQYAVFSIRLCFGIATYNGEEI